MLRRSYYRRFGLAAAGVIALGSLAAAVVYRGTAGERYSPLNHAVSELGQVGVSAWALAFNAGLVLGGALLMVYLLGAGAHQGPPVGYLAGAAGAVAAVFCALVGVFPMNLMSAHTWAAGWFFRSGMLAMALFSLAVALDKRRRVPRWFALPGLLAVLAAGLLLIKPLAARRSQAMAEILSHGRPSVLWPALAEWLVVAGGLGWVVLAARIKEP